MTSSLTQSVPNASRASFAVSTASPAVAHPAVFGSTRTPSSWSNERSEPRPDASTLLTATVATAAPDSTQRAAQRFEAGHPAGAEEEARAQYLAGDGQTLARCHGTTLPRRQGPP